ncbi:MAG: type II toxin-antitoxin system RelE/ParE family toxin [Rhodocyclaceae bacterium]|nr:type II toxin-antitoxin system RelE/ParE family toxin [Rhodocyclaceae bacterium]
MKVRWTPEAQDDRAQIFDYIAADSPCAAVKMDETFSKSAARLADHPKLGRTGRIPGTREVIPHKSYCLVYEIEQEIAWVLALVHTARQWPPVAE